MITELVEASLAWPKGSLVEYKGGSVPVKGRVTLVYSDVSGIFVCVLVTSRTHPLYQKNMELTFAWDNPKLRMRHPRIRNSDHGTEL